MKHTRRPTTTARAGAPAPVRARGRGTPAPPGNAARALPSWTAPAAIAALVAALGVDTFRIGFFADDFHFLDVARRVPLWSVLGGQHGIYPWYRPLSRELYFALVAPAGPLALAAAHTLSLACVAGCAWQIRALAARLSGPRASAIAAVLFLTYATTKFLAAWASGFQDLLALLLVLSAVREQFERRPLRALAFAFLATFAKESAVLVFPLLAAHALLFRDERPAWRALLAQAGVFVAAAAVHFAVRATWQSGGRHAPIEPSLPALAAALARVAGGFVARPGAGDPVALAVAVLAAAATAALLAQAAGRARVAPSPGEPAHGSEPQGQPVAFVGIGAVLGLAPLAIGHVMGVVTPSEYYAFSAVPWIAMLVASALARLPRTVGSTIVVSLVAWNTLALGYRAPDLSSADAWSFRNWDWSEAVRLSAVSRRFAQDLESRLASRPESLVVLCADMPRGCYFQSEDGPAIRECLRDPTVRSYWLNATPYGLRTGGFEILAFDSESKHLVPATFALEDRGRLTATAVATGNAAVARAFACYGDSAENARFEFRYYRAAAALVAEGVPGARRELAAVGLDDTTGPATERWADQAVGATHPLHARMAATLRRPLDAGAHLAFAHACRGLDMVVFEAVELRIATALDPGLVAERLRLAQSLLAHGQSSAARRDLERLAVDARGTPTEGAARRLLAGVRQGQEADEAGSTLRAFNPR